MNPSKYTKIALSAVTLILFTAALSSAASPGAAKPTAVFSRDVIVILRDQRPDLPPMGEMRAARAAALASAQTPIIAHLRASGAARVRGFALINAVAARVTPDEADALAANPLVQAVVPDRVIRMRPRNAEAAATGNKGGSSGSGGGGGGGKPAALCNTLEPEALQLMNVAFLDPTKPQAQRIVDGKGDFVTGKGVKVAFIADGLDTTLPGFTHTDGTPVFIDYQNFNGDPAGTPTGGGEAFGDASSIAAQDTPNGKPLFFDLNSYVNAAHALPSPCNVRIRGVAPGASLVGLDVFSSLGISTNSNFVQAIEYAVFHDDVDVINESFGGNPFPDNDNDPIALADRAAVAAGVTVVVSTGDAGYNGTLGTPSTDSEIISSGASTQFRSYIQSGYGAAPLATNGWVSNNISALSSGGFSMSGPRVPNTVAPGDLGWALCSTNTAQYQECTNFQAPAVGAPIQLFGGTSESSPLTAGTAALVIQAYRSTHNGRNPSPALVKKILMSTATDLGAPPTEQGAGLIDAYQAVKAALSVVDGNGHPKATGTALLNSAQSASVVDEPGAPQTLSFAITNTGSSSQHLSPVLQGLGAPIAGQTLTVTLDPSTDPTFPNVTGSPRAYVIKKFTVPNGAQHLDAAIAWQSPFTVAPTYAYLGLIDPKGRNAAYSLPQGEGSAYGHVDIVDPVPGTWTAIIYTRAAGISGAYAGPVQFSWSAERYVTFGSVAPASFNLAPGATQWISARFKMPAQPGDQSVAVRFSPWGVPRDDGGAHSQIPIALRTLIPTSSRGGFFNGTLTGGNGRDATGPTQTFAFNVPSGVDNMSLNLQMSDPLYLLEGLLIAPNGMQLSVQANVDANGNSSGVMQLNRSNPQAGQWRFILLQNYFSSGNQTSLPFTGQINFDGAQVNAIGLPHGSKLSVGGGAVTVPVTVTNTSGLAQAYFADARIEGGAFTTLTFGTFVATANCGPGTTLPYACFGTFLPTEVRSAQFTASAGGPITMDTANNVGYIVGLTGAPDLYAKSIGPNTVAASISESEVPWGEWLLFPTLVGPYGPAGAPTTAVNTTVTAQLKPFDATVAADSGDLWSDVTFGTNTFNPLVLPPGATGTINVIFTPAPTQIGTTVRGAIYIDTFNPTVQTGDEMVKLPYSYTVTP